MHNATVEAKIAEIQALCLEILDELACTPPSGLPLVNGELPYYHADFANDVYYRGADMDFAGFLTATGFALGKAERFTPEGLLLEGTRANLMWPSKDFTHARWNKGSGVTVNVVGGVSQIHETAANVFHDFTQNITVTPGHRYVLSVELEAGTSSLLTLWLGNGNGIAAHVNLAAGTIGAPFDWDGTAGATEMESHIYPRVGGGYRCILTGKLPTKTSLNCGFMLRNGPSAGAYIGNTANYIKLHGMQLEKAPYATSHITTTTGPLTRTTDTLQRLTGTSITAITQVVRFKTGMGAPNDVAADDIYSVMTHFDNNDAANYSDVDTYWFKDGKLYIEIHKGPGPAVTRALVEVGALTPSADYCLAYTASAAGVVASLNGAAVVTGAVSAWPADLTHERLGMNAQATPTRALNSTIASSTLWVNQVATPAQLVTMSVL